MIVKVKKKDMKRREFLFFPNGVLHAVSYEIDQPDVVDIPTSA